MTDDERKYLLSLVRMDIRKKERALEKVTPKPGQSQAEFAHVYERLVLNLKFRRGVLKTLEGE